MAASYSHMHAAAAYTARATRGRIRPVCAPAGQAVVCPRRETLGTIHNTYPFILSFKTEYAI
jgi:hypothetical protein